MRPDQRRIEYSGSVHDEEEIEAVVEVLRGGPSALRISKNVKAFEQGVAEYFGKRRGIMVNSGSSALYLAVELLGCEPGDEVITSSVTFSTDVAPLVRAGIVPAFVDVEPDTFNIDVDGIEEMISPRTKAILVPNLIGNCPDWDRIRAIADAHGLTVIEDSCDALGAKLRGTPTGTRSDISVTSFALAHVITAAATGGMVLLDDDDLDRPVRAAAPLGSSVRDAVLRFEEGRQALLHRGRRHRVRQPLHLRRGGLELRAERDQRRVRRGAAAQAAAEPRPAPAQLRAAVGVLRHATPTCSCCRARPTELETGWHMFPVLIRPESGIRRAEFQEHMEGHGVDTRMVWTGNVTRQPAFAKVPHRVPEGGLPNADRVMEQGLILPLNHGLDDDDIEYLCVTAGRFLQEHGFAPAGVAS